MSADIFHVTFENDGAVDVTLSWTGEETDLDLWIVLGEEYYEDAEAGEEDWASWPRLLVAASLETAMTDVELRMQAFLLNRTHVDEGGDMNRNMTRLVQVFESLLA